MLWRASDGKQLRVIESGTISNLSFSPDGSLLASCFFASEEVKLWNTTTGRLVLKLPGHIGGGLDCKFSSDGKHLITAARDADVRLWEIASGKCIRSLPTIHRQPEMIGPRLHDNSVRRQRQHRRRSAVQCDQCMGYGPWHASPKTRGFSKWAIGNIRSLEGSLDKKP